MEFWVHSLKRNKALLRYYTSLDLKAQDISLRVDKYIKLVDMIHAATPNQQNAVLEIFTFFTISM